MASRASVADKGNRNQHRRPKGIGGRLRLQLCLRSGSGVEYAELIAGVERFGEAAWVAAPMEGVPVGAQKAERLLGGFIQQFDPEFSQPGFEKTRQVGNPGLGAGIEDGIAATDIGPDGVGFADAVADGDAVAVAGAATGEVVFSL